MLSAMVVHDIFLFLHGVSSSYYSYQPVYVSWRRAHGREVAFYTLYIGLRYNNLCTYWVTCTIIEPYIVPAILIFPTWNDTPPRLPPSHVFVYPHDFLQRNALNLPHRPCLRAPDLPFLCRPFRSAPFWGCPPSPVTVNLHWLPASDGIQPMPG